MNSPKTIIMCEYSSSWTLGDEPYYPIDNPESRDLLARYQTEAVTIPKLVVGGSLGEYKYYDIDKSIDAAMKLLLVK